MSLAPTPPVDVFISYTREDRARVVPIIDGLRDSGLRVWWDGDIPGGASWRRTLVEHLDSARCVLVVWSETSASDSGEFVQEEASHAKSRHVLLPLRIDDVAEPLGYGELQSLDLVAWSGNIEDSRFKNLVAAVKAMLAGGPPPAAPALTRPQGATTWLDRSIAATRLYLADLGDLVSGPKRFLAERLAERGSGLEEGLRFLTLSFLFTEVLELPLVRGNPLFEILADAGFVVAYVLLFGCAVYLAWRLVGASAPFHRFITAYFYLAAVGKIIQTLFYVTARGLLRSDRAVYDEVMASAYRGDLTWLATSMTRLSGYRVFQLFLLVLLCGWGVMFAWLLAGWGSYRELTGLTRSRSALAFLIFCIICVPIYILTVLISAALVS